MIKELKRKEWIKIKPLKLFPYLAISLCFLGSCKPKEDKIVEKPTFSNVSVHDPSVIKTKDEYFVIGSHLQAAKSSNLIEWTPVSKSVPLNTLFKDVYKEFADEFAYAKTDTFWAGDIVQLKNGKYYMYYCLCKGDQPLSVLGVAVSDSVEGPYEKIESFLYSGTSPQFDQTYDATKQPNVIDPHVFYDESGQLWMVYGSYSGGIFMLEMDDTTGLPKDRSTYGKKLMGGNHSRIEAPYIIYNSETEYYYLFVSFGGLDSFGGYNMRVARSKNPDGPYEDIEGQLMENAIGKEKSIFDDVSIAPFGNKLMGNFTLVPNDGMTNDGYVSPGHNSVYYDKDKGKFFLIFHTRFPNGGEMHELRVHELFFTEDGWPIVDPLRYSNTGERVKNKKDVHKKYKAIETSKEISGDITDPIHVELKKNGVITGAINGSWTYNPKGKEDRLTLDNVTYKGGFYQNWDPSQEAYVTTFSGVSNQGVPIFLIEEKK